MNIGVFLGSFDPIHIDHLKVVNEVINQSSIDVLYVVPAVRNPWKEHEPAPYDIRCNMVMDAVAPFNRHSRKVITSRIEEQIMFRKKDADCVYSFETLNAIRDLYHGDDKFFIICGEDVKDTIHKWKSYYEFIKPYWNLITFNRPEGTCSSTVIRQMVADGKEIYPLVPTSVKEYIINNHLYGSKKL